MTKRKLKLKLKNGTQTEQGMKPREEKSHKLLSKTQNQKTGLKAPQRVVEKNFSGPTYDTYISHQDPMIYNCQHVRES